MEDIKKLIEDLSTAKVHTIEIDQRIESPAHHLPNIPYIGEVESIFSSIESVLYR
jgi:hypothetical protein